MEKMARHQPSISSRYFAMGRILRPLNTNLYPSRQVTSHTRKSLASFVSLRLMYFAFHFRFSTFDFLYSLPYSSFLIPYSSFHLALLSSNAGLGASFRGFSFTSFFTSSTARINCGSLPLASCAGSSHTSIVGGYTLAFPEPFAIRTI